MNITTPSEHFNNNLNEPQKMNNKKVIYLVFGIIGVIVIGYLFLGQNMALAPSKDMGDDTINLEDNNSDIIASENITVLNQIPGEIVLIEEITMIEGGWVVIHDNDGDDQPWKILGAYYLPAGNYQNQIIPLLRAIVDGNSYLVVIHKDDGDIVFNYKVDTPVIDQNNLMITANFIVIAENPRGE